MASRITRAIVIEQRAYDAYVTASAELIARSTVTEDAETERLRRRAGAYRAQWNAASRRVEELTEREVTQ